MSTRRSADFGGQFTITSEKKSYEKKESEMHWYVTGMSEIHVTLRSGDRFLVSPSCQSMLISADDAWDLMEWLEANLEPAKARTIRF